MLFRSCVLAFDLHGGDGTNFGLARFNPSPLFGALYGFRTLGRIEGASGTEHARYATCLRKYFVVCRNRSIDQANFLGDRLKT